jgi:glycosyltransferase involved in cell wall biosynthesis
MHLGAFHSPANSKHVKEVFEALAQESPSPGGGEVRQVAPLGRRTCVSTSPFALVHDYLLVLRGAERTFAAMADVWPEAPVYTLLYDRDATEERFEAHPVYSSPLQRVGARQAGFRRLLPLLPLAARRLPVRDADVVVSSSSAFAHGVRPGPDAVHVCYCHSPFRYAWHERERGLSEAPTPLRPALDAVLRAIRRWDLRSTRGVTRYIANSNITRERIQKFWNRDSSVVHPPVSVERFERDEPEDYFLFVGEVVRHKRVELALEAASRAGARIKVVGTGPELERLRTLYGDSAEFVGRAEDGQLEKLYARARALVMPNVEEFGITAVEAQAAGRPVIAAGAGGALETVVEGETGVHFKPGQVDELAEAMRDTDFDRFDPDKIVGNARRFSTRRFQKRLRRAVDVAVAA